MHEPTLQLPTHVHDALVRYEPVPPPDPGAQRMGEQSWILPDAVWADLLGVSIMVRGTDEVVVDIPPDVDRTIIAPLLYGWVTRVLMLHAGIFNLHCSLVRVGDEHVLIGGHSGAGKSTTVVTLAHRLGATVLIDDVVHVTIEDGTPIAHPFSRPVHLTHDAVARLGLEGQGEVIGQGAISKRAIDLAESSGPVPVDRLVALIGYDPDPDELLPNSILPAVLPTTDRPVVARTVTGGERLRWIIRLANESGLSSFGPRAGAFFEWSTTLAAALPTIEIARLRSVDTLDQVCRLVTTGVPESSE